MARFIDPTTRRLTQEWAEEFYWFKGRAYRDGFYHSLGWNGHNGRDFGCYVGDPVVAAADGIVEWAGWGDLHPLLTGGGGAILIQHGDVRTEYLHLSSYAVRPFQWVRQGELIGYSGDTGTATAPHLHFGFLPPLDSQVNQGDGWRGRLDPGPWLTAPTLAPAGTTTTTEEDDMLDSDRANLEKIVRSNETIISMLTNMAGWMNESGNETRDNVRKVVHAAVDGEKL